MSENIKLTSLTKTSGCAAKIGPGVLHEVLSSLPKFEDPNLLVGFETNDDACVYKINDNTVAIQTVDFFPPMVDDPYIFGQIAAANECTNITGFSLVGHGYEKASGNNKAIEIFSSSVPIIDEALG